MQRLDAPIRLDKASHQPIEQLRVRWQLSSVTEVARSVHQSVAEVVHPNTIDHDASG